MCASRGHRCSSPDSEIEEPKGEREEYWKQYDMYLYFYSRFPQRFAENANNFVGKERAFSAANFANPQIRFLNYYVCSRLI
jgi:hypothetical protein